MQTKLQSVRRAAIAKPTEARFLRARFFGMAAQFYYAADGNSEFRDIKEDIESRIGFLMHARLHSGRLEPPFTGFPHRGEWPVEQLAQELARNLEIGRADLDKRKPAGHGLSPFGCLDHTTRMPEG